MFVKRLTRDIVTEDYDIEGGYVVDLTGPVTVGAIGSGVCAVVGEFLKGPSVPTEVFSSDDIKNVFGSWSPYWNPGHTMISGSNQPLVGDEEAYVFNTEGNGLVSLFNKKFPRLFITNVDLHVTDCTITVNSATDVALTIPAGTLVSDADESDVFATCDDIVVTADDYTSHVAVFKNVNLRRVSGTALTTVTLTKCKNTDAILVANEFEAGDATFVPSAIGTIVDYTQSFIEAQYVAAIGEWSVEDVDINSINLIWSARHSEVIASALKANAIEASQKNAAGRIAVIAPVVGTAKATAIGSSGLAVGNTSIARSDRVVFAFPAIKQYFGFISTGTISAEQDPIQELTADSSVVSIMSQLPPELNPAQLTDIPTWVLGLEETNKKLSKADYISFRSKGVVAFNMDPSFGAMLQSGVTSVDPAVLPNKRNIARRRMSDFISGSLVTYAAQFKSKAYNTKNFNILCGGVSSFLAGLKTDQRIADYSTDFVTANTADKTALGIVTLIVRVRTLASMDFITFVTEIGETVEVSVK
jgi:hypothetical protein